NLGCFANGAGDVKFHLSDASARYYQYRSQIGSAALDARRTARSSPVCAENDLRRTVQGFALRLFAVTRQPPAAFDESKCGGGLVVRPGRDQWTGLLCRLAQGVAAQGLDVVAAFEGRGVGHGTAAEAAAHLADGLVLVLLHPAQQVGLNSCEVRDAVDEQRRGQHGNLSAGHNGLQDVLGAVHASGDSDVRAEIAVEDCSPVQTQQQLLRPAEGEPGSDAEGFDVEVRLVEAVEEDDGIGSDLIQLGGQVGNAGELRGEFDRDGDGGALLHLAHQIDDSIFDGGAGDARVGGQRVGVELERVRAGLFDLFGKLHPSAGGRAVQAGEDGNAGDALGAADVTEVGVVSLAVAGIGGEVAER